MCGIAGLLEQGNREQRRATLQRMTDAIAHRGPDDEGFFVDDLIALGHRRLSIIDLSPGGSQPKSSTNGRYHLVYNGELYNYQSLRQQLINAGLKFRTKSDTEVVLQAIIYWGMQDACRRFNGMFALALWDSQARTLELSRDRFGIKPLYWTKDTNGFAFASEIKALLERNNMSRSVSLQGLMEYLYYGNALGANTLFQNCQRVEAGHSLIVDAHGNISQKPWWTLSDVPCAEEKTEADAVESVKAALHQAVHRHLIADVPVALLLSGGLDSSSICAIASKAYAGKIKTISVDFAAKTANSELAAARLVAETFKTEHHEQRLSYQNLSDLLQTMVKCHDQPFGDAANIPLYVLTKGLSSTAKVVLQGDGGDEIFGGYRRYRLLQHVNSWRWYSRILPVPRFLCQHSTNAKRLRRMQDALGKSSGATQLAKLLTEEWEDGGISTLLTDQNVLNTCNPFKRYEQLYTSVKHLDPAQAMMHIDTQILLPDIFLEKVDRSTMANGVEVRVPFLDTELADTVMGISSNLKLRGNSKNLLRQAMSGVLPERITQGPKLGFGVPYAEWLAGPLAEFTREKLTDQNGFLCQIMDRDSLHKLCDQHMNKGVNHGFMLYKLLMLSIWGEEYRVV